jgi:hypothetical protein
VHRTTIIERTAPASGGSSFLPALVGSVAGSAIGGALFNSDGKEVVKCFDAQDAEVACPPTAGE